MFESNDDCLDVDDEFLNEVFESEQTHLNSNYALDFGNKQTRNGPLEPQCHLRSEDQSSTLSNYKIFPVAGHNIDKSIPSSRQIHFSAEENKEEGLGNKENKRKHSSSITPIRTKRERKFPGPAGLLPDRKSRGFTPVKLDSLLEADNSHSSPTSEDLCSQGRCSGSILEEEPWQNFLADLGTDSSILNEVNVASVKRKAAAKCFVGRKVPFLAAVLHHLDVSSPDPCIILRDSTGEIHGTLHREVWELFAAELVVGSVLVIRNVGLLSTGISSRRHYLNITANNLVTIYAANSGKPKNDWLETQDFAQSIQNWRSLVSPSFGMGSPASVGSPGLFNSTVCSPFSNSPGQSTSNPTGTISNTHRETKVDFNRCFSKTPQDLKFNLGKSGSLVRKTEVGKNLMHSFLPNTCNNIPKNNNHHASNNLFKSFPNQNQISNNRIFSEPTKNIKTTGMGSSNFVHPAMKTMLRNSKEDTSKTEIFNFDPAIHESKKFSCEIFPQSNSERQIRTSEIPKINICIANNKTLSTTVNNNSKLVLSQSTQLTTEEKSLVESVFDGVDADSLFDDDF